MRPIEFSLLERDAAKKVNGKYILNIINGKEFDTIKKITGSSYRTVEITQKLYNLIHEYIYSCNLQNEKYLFNYEIYARYYENRRSYDRFLDIHRDNYAGTERFYNLLNKFYSEVIEKQYGYCIYSDSEKTDTDKQLNHIEVIRPGDTRHFAICNLYLQGNNPLTIARLAGHETIYTQLGYANHMNTFAESKVKLLADEIKRRRSFNIEHIDFMHKKTIYEKSLFLNPNNCESIRPVEDGYCIDKDYPSHCMLGSCEDQCEYFRYVLNKDKDIIKLSNKSMSYDKDIKKYVGLLRDIIRKSDLNKNNVSKNKCFNIKDQEEIGVCSKKIQQAIVNKAFIDSYILEAREVENVDE